MAMYDETDSGSKTSIVSGTGTDKKEVYKKSTEACVQNMKSDAYQQTYLYPNTYTIGSRLKRNSYNVGAIIDMPKQIHKRACRQCSRPTSHWVSDCNQCGIGINWCSKANGNEMDDISTVYDIGTDLSVWGCDNVNNNTKVVVNQTKGKAKEGGVYVIEPAKNCSTKSCKQNPLSVHTNTCVDGQPYYTYVGTYDDTIGLVKKLWKLKSDIDNNTHTYTLIDPDTKTSFGTIDTVHIWGFLSLYKIQLTGNPQKYNVVSLSFKMSSIEIYSEAESKYNTKYYHLKKEKK